MTMYLLQRQTLKTPQLQRQAVKTPQLERQAVKEVP